MKKKKVVHITSQDTCTYTWMCWILTCKYWAESQLYAVGELCSVHVQGFEDSKFLDVSGAGQSSLLQSVHRIWPRSGKKPEPTSDTEQREHLKHGWCHCRSSKEMYLPSPNPVRWTHERLMRNGFRMEFNNRLAATLQNWYEFMIRSVGRDHKKTLLAPLAFITAVESI